MFSIKMQSETIKYLSLNDFNWPPNITQFMYIIKTSLNFAAELATQNHTFYNYKNCE